MTPGIEMAQSLGLSVFQKKIFEHLLWDYFANCIQISLECSLGCSLIKLKNYDPNT